MSIPGLRDLILLESAREVNLSPSGRWAAVRIDHAHWEDNRYCRDVLIVDVEAGRTHRLTRFAACDQMHWLGDDTLAILSSDGSADATPQVYIYEGLIGDGWQVTAAEHGVTAFEPFRDGIVYLARTPEDPARDTREDLFGTYLHAEAEPGRTGAYYLDLPRFAGHQRASARATAAEREHLDRPDIELSAALAEPLAIQGVVTSPAGDAVYLNTMPTDDITRVLESAVYRVAFDASGAEPAAGTAQRLPLPERAAIEAVSPDGTGLLFRFPGRDTRMSTNRELWAAERDALLGSSSVSESRGLLRDVTAGVDHTCFAPVWHDGGIDVYHAEGTRVALRRLDPAGRQPPARIDTGPVWCQLAFHTTREGQVAFIGDNSRSYPEAWLLTPDGPQRLTDLGAQIAGWELGEVRTIRWTSTDGTEIEGVLRLPPNFDPSRRYPLAFVVHGGPTWFDTEQLLPAQARMYYPEVQLAAQDVIVLHPNYRGSLGRGLDFQESNVGNLGVGDLWDLESAIDHLDALGWVDPAKVGSMGWSQGGYISAFAGTHTDRFAAVSVGAGVSDWYTYAISNDIPAFTRDFMRVELFGPDRETLAAAAPISAIARASTPMLLQHGDADRRVPLSNAMELYRGLRERGVPVELFVYPGFGHPITKPRDNHAVLHQNLTWFRHWLLGEELDLAGASVLSKVDVGRERPD